MLVVTRATVIIKKSMAMTIKLLRWDNDNNIEGDDNDVDSSDDEDFDEETSSRNHVTQMRGQS